MAQYETRGQVNISGWIQSPLPSTDDLHAPDQILLLFIGAALVSAAVIFLLRIEAR